MLIHGFQKLTLLDYPGKTACTVFTGGCNLRCPFCHNAELVTAPHSYPIVPEEEVFALIKKRKNTLDGVCVTGGEPMLRKDLPEFLEKLKSFGISVKVDTNGSFPDQLKYIVRSGLADYIAMDVKNSFDRYHETVGINTLELSKIKESIDFLKASGIDHEFRTTVCRDFHTEKELCEIASYLGEHEKYYLQAFKPSPSSFDPNITGYTPSELKELLERVKEIAPLTELRGV